MKKVFIPLLLALAACGRSNEAVLSFQGTTPATGVVKNERVIVARCPYCGAELAPESSTCSRSSCGAEIAWGENYICGWCRGTGQCQACVMMDQRDGKCTNCRGEGVVVFAGKSVPCPNCKQTGKCPLCSGTKACDACSGGKFSGSNVKKYAPSPKTEETP